MARPGRSAWSACARASELTQIKALYRDPVMSRPSMAGDAIADRAHAIDPIVRAQTMTTPTNVADDAVAARSRQESSRKQAAPAGRTLRVWAVLGNAIRRHFQRARIKHELSHMSDHGLRDIGFEPGLLDMQVDARLRAEEAKRANQTRNHRELMAYSDAELQDIGVHRSDIPAIARGAFEAANDERLRICRQDVAQRASHGRDAAGFPRPGDKP